MLLNLSFNFQPSYDSPWALNTNFPTGGVHSNGITKAMQNIFKVYMNI